MPPGRIAAKPSNKRSRPLIPPRFQIAAGLALACSLAVTARLGAQPQSQYPASPTVPFTPATGHCLTPEQQKVNDKYNSLNRPTQPGDDQPFWDPEYLVGTWDVDMRSQETPLGPGGPSMGTMTIKGSGSNPCQYEGTLEAEDPDGKPFTRTISAIYDPVKKVLNWTEKDSRGYTIAKQGPVGGELGGLFHHHFGDDPSTPATTAAGHNFKFKGVSEMSSPAYFKTDMQVSIDGAPFKTFGRVAYEKQLPDNR
jgi:hypothetical protein